MMLHLLPHMMKLVWKRKSRNLMVSLEILVAFVLVFGVAAVGARMAQLYRMPTGFVYENVWSVRMRAPDLTDAHYDSGRFDAYKRAVEAMPEVEKAAFSTFSPYRRQIQSNDFVPPGGGARFALPGVGRCPGCASDAGWATGAPRPSGSGRTGRPTGRRTPVRVPNTPAASSGHVSGESGSSVSRSSRA